MHPFFPVFFQLLRRDLLIFWRNYPSRFIDVIIYFLSNAIVWGYFMPRHLVSSDYGPFIIIGAIANYGLSQFISKVSLFVSDAEGTKSLSYFLVMPTPSSSIFGYIGLLWSINSILISILLFPLGKLLLFNQFSLENVSYFRLALMFVAANLFYGYFTLWIASLIKDTSGLGWLWSRVMSPMWMFGGYFYSWEAVFQFSPLLGYLNLINPMVFVLEGMRAAALGQKGFIPFWISFSVILVWILFCMIHGIIRLKKRYDCL